MHDVPCYVIFSIFFAFFCETQLFSSAHCSFGWISYTKCEPNLSDDYGFEVYSRRHILVPPAGKTPLFRIVGVVVNSGRNHITTYLQENFKIDVLKLKKKRSVRSAAGRVHNMYVACGIIYGSYRMPSMLKVSKAV